MHAHIKTECWQTVPTEILCIGITTFQFRHFQCCHLLSAATHSFNIHVANDNVFYRIFLDTRNQRALQTVVRTFDVLDYHVLQISGMLHLLVEPASAITDTEKDGATATVYLYILYQDVLDVSSVHSSQVIPVLQSSRLRKDWEAPGRPPSTNLRAMRLR